MSKPTAAEREGFAALEAIYAQLPTIVCQGRCGYACGPILVTELEARRLQLATHTKPRTVADDGRGVAFDQHERCIYLTDAGRCRAYAVRPLICRVWGLLRSLSCPHGCVPDRWLGDVAFAELGRRVERLAGRQLRTMPDGLTYHAGDSWFSIGTPTRTPEAIEANAERTRSLRALHGGYILAAVDETKP